MTYYQCIAETISYGGDTDTNGAIVGGMIGALVGKSGLPPEMIKKVLFCDLSKG